MQAVFIYFLIGLFLHPLMYCFNCYANPQFKRSQLHMCRNNSWYRVLLVHMVAYSLYFFNVIPTVKNIIKMFKERKNHV